MENGWVEEAHSALKLRFSFGETRLNNARMVSKTGGRTRVYAMPPSIRDNSFGNLYESILFFLKNLTLEVKILGEPSVITER